MQQGFPFLFLEEGHAVVEMSERNTVNGIRLLSLVVRCPHLWNILVHFWIWNLLSNQSWKAPKLYLTSAIPVVSTFCPLLLPSQFLFSFCGKIQNPGAIHTDTHITLMTENSKSSWDCDETVSRGGFSSGELVQTKHWCRRSLYLQEKKIKGVCIK